MRRCILRRTRRTFACTCGILAVFATWAAAARAVDYSWINPGGGSFAQPVFWSPFDPVFPPPILLGPGGASDTTHFNLGLAPANRYTVSNVSGENDRLLVHNDSLTLEIADYALLNDEAGLDSISFVVGVADGDNADVILTGNAGANLNAYRTSIAHEAGSTGTVLVTGDNWQWNASQLFVGELGEGTLNITGGGSVAAGLSHVGMFAGSTGMATVSGANSTWHTNSANVGGGGTGTVTIEDGGTYTTDRLDLGNSIVGNGTITVRGAGSSWTNDGPLFVGYHGTGSIDVENGGTFTSRGGAFGGWDDEGAGTASITIEGAGSVWNVIADDDQVAAVSIGRASTGTLTIRDGGTVNNAARSYLGYRAGSSGFATVTGDGSSWTHAGDLIVGREGSGALTIKAGGDVVNATGWIGEHAGSMGSVAVRGDGATWTNDGELFVGNHGSGEMNIEAGGAVASNGVWIGSSPGANGAVTVRGDRSIWNADGQFIVGYRAKGVMTIESGGSVRNDGDSFIGFTGMNDSRATVTGAGSAWTNSGSLAVGHNTGKGSLSVERGGSVTARGGMSVGLFGHVAGDGTIVADVINSGIFAPGNAVGRLQVDGDYEQSPDSGILEIELASIDKHDQLAVSKRATLAGTLDVLLVDGFAPTVPGESFTIVTARSLSGEFDNIFGQPSAALPGLSWTVQYTPMSAILSTSAIPGDINLDGTVNIVDLNAVRNHFGETGNADGTLPGDAFPFDGLVNIGDLNVVRNNFGAGLAAVPEPSAIGLALLGVLTIALRRRRA